jgi:polar amino acid transport system permease protein
MRREPADALRPALPHLQRVPFRVRVALVWAGLLALFVAFFLTFDLKFSFILEKFPSLAGLQLTRDGFFQGAALTLFVCLLAMVASILLGFLSALGRLSASALLFGVSTFYTSFFRGTPLLVQIFLIYLGLPQLGPVPAAIPSGIIALSLNYGAYLSEIFRAGILAIPHGQREAAAALGLHRGVVLWTIVLPQAMRIIIPPTGTQFIAMLKDSSLISVMGVWEIMFLAQSFGRASYRYIEMLMTAAAIYWVLSIIFEIVQSRLEEHYGKGFEPAGRSRPAARNIA